MSRGGAKPGERRGGRKRGTRNKRTEAIAAKAAKGGELPLDYMLRIMRDEGADKADRNWAAGQAAPFVHPRLLATEHSGKDGGPIVLSWEK